MKPLSIADECELIAWRKLHARLLGVIEQNLRAYGESAPAELVSLQHALIELSRPPFGGASLCPGVKSAAEQVEVPQANTGSARGDTFQA